MDEMTYTGLRCHLDDADDDHALQMDGFDNCVIGAGTIAGNWVLIYSEELIIKELMTEMSLDDAWEYYAFNMTGHVGSGTPVIQSVKITPKDQT